MTIDTIAHTVNLPLPVFHVPPTLSERLDEAEHAALREEIRGLLARENAVLVAHYYTDAKLQALGKFHCALVVHEREHLPRADVTYQFDSEAGAVRVHITSAGETFKLDISAGKNPMAAQLACVELERQLNFIGLSG